MPEGQRHTLHRARPKHRAAQPVHVTLRASVRSLRSQQVVRTVLGALRDSRRESFRIVHYSIQDNVALHWHPGFLQVYALAELWVSYANGSDEGPLLNGTGVRLPPASAPN